MRRNANSETSRITKTSLGLISLASLVTACAAQNQEVTGQPISVHRLKDTTCDVSTPPNFHVAPAETRYGRFKKLAVGIHATACVTAYQTAQEVLDVANNPKRFPRQAGFSAEAYKDNGVYHVQFNIDNPAYALRAGTVDLDLKAGTPRRAGLLAVNVYYRDSSNRNELATFVLTDRKEGDKIISYPISGDGTSANCAPAIPDFDTTHEATWPTTNQTVESLQDHRNLITTLGIDLKTALTHPDLPVACQY